MEAEAADAAAERRHTTASVSDMSVFEPSALHHGSSFLQRHPSIRSVMDHEADLGADRRASRFSAGPTADILTGTSSTDDSMVPLHAPSNIGGGKKAKQPAHMRRRSSFDGLPGVGDGHGHAVGRRTAVALEPHGSAQSGCCGGGCGGVAGGKGGGGAGAGWQQPVQLQPARAS